MIGLARSHQLSKPILLLCTFVVFAAFQSPGAALGGENARQLAQSTEPKRHFRVERPASLDGAEALTIYNEVLAEISDGYAVSGDPTARDYRQWQRYNSAPYRSATHGERFVNNYANDLGRDYGKFEAAGPLPPGAVLAKDSFAVTTRGDVFAGPLFLMEKMPSGFAPKLRDWRYTMIMPDGSLFGTTKGQGSEKVEFCATCHIAAGEDNDHLFYIPEESRLRVLRVPSSD